MDDIERLPKQPKVVYGAGGKIMPPPGNHPLLPTPDEPRQSPDGTYQDEEGNLYQIYGVPGVPGSKNVSINGMASYEWYDGLNVAFMYGGRHPYTFPYDDSQDGNYYGSTT